jgi:hypothetical protein
MHGESLEKWKWCCEAFSNSTTGLGVPLRKHIRSQALPCRTDGLTCY